MKVKPRRFELRIGALVAAMAFAAVLSRATGSMAVSPFHDAFSVITRPDGEQQVCWHGLCPGLSKLAEVALDNDPHLKKIDDGTTLPSGMGCWQTADEGFRVCIGGTIPYVSQIDLQYQETLDNPPFGPNPDRLLAADLIAKIGIPTAVEGPYCTQGTLYFPGHAVATVRWSQVNATANRWALSPTQSPLLTITILSNGKTPERPAQPWRGFVGTNDPQWCGEG